MDERIRQIIEHPQRVPIGVGVVSFSVGVVTGYILRSRRKYELHVDNYVMDLEEDGDVLVPEGHIEVTDEQSPIDLGPGDALILTDNGRGVTRTFEPPPVVISGEEFVARKIREQMEDNPTPEPEVEIVSHSVFAGDNDSWNYEEEVKNRKPGMPYILHRDEFFANEKGFAQVTLTYYDGDGIVADEDEKPVYKYSEATGDLRWGHGSCDPKVVYIRNEKLKCEYEVCFDPGHYSVEVQGLEIEETSRERELKHSAMRNSRFRPTEE